MKIGRKVTPYATNKISSKSESYLKIGFPTKTRKQIELAKYAISQTIC